MIRAVALVGLLLALPVRAAVDPRAPAPEGVCVGPKAGKALSWSVGRPVCSAVEPAAHPLVFGTALRRPGRR